MSSQETQQIEQALEIRREILHELRHGKLSRREMYRKLLFAGGAIAAFTQLRGTGGSAWAQTVTSLATGAPMPGPFTTPFREELVHVNRPEYVKQPEALVPAPTREANTSAGGIAETRRPPHQAWDRFWAGVPASQRKTYRLVARPFDARPHPELPAQPAWGYDGRYPGPTFHSRYGEPAIVRLVNELPPPSQHRGFGLPEITMHLHNQHTPWESDGNPDEYFPKLTEPDPAKRDPGRFRDHHYPNYPAGGDPREALGTLWYHDHRHSFTAQNVYRGLAGFHLIFDELDSNNENDSNPRALRLPSGEYDVPLALSDRIITRDRVTIFDDMDFDGLIGNKYVVNGKIQPYFQVEPRKYRLRLLAQSISRTFGLAFAVSDSPNGPINATYIPAQVIATDGNLLPGPQPMRNPTPLSSARRLDVVVDFSQLPAGKRYVYLVNRYVQKDGRMPEGFLGADPNGPFFKPMDGAGDAIMRFDVVLAGRGDPSRVPAQLRPLPWDPNDALSRLTVDQIEDAVGKSRPFPGVETVREWEFNRNNGQWAINGELYDGDRPAATPGLGTAEIWILKGGGAWVHPAHIHHEEFRTLYRAEKRPGPNDLYYGRNDTVELQPGELTITYRRFRDWTGRYVIHCHNTAHEDHAMMMRWDVRG